VKALLAALAVATATRVTVFGLAVRHHGRFETPDSFEYETLARHFDRAYLHGDFLALSLRRPPGYPALVAALGTNVTATIVVELVLSVATVAGVWLLARQLAGETAAAVAAFALALDPISIVMASNLTTETLFAALWVGATLLWIRGTTWSVAGAGFVFGLSVLVRPIAQWLWVLLVPLTLVLWRPRAAVACLVAFAVPVALWVERNHHETGVVTVSTISATNLLDYRAAGALAIDEHLSLADAQRRLEARIRPDANPAREAQQRSSLAWHTLAHHPVAAVRTTVEGLGRVLFGPGRAELSRLVLGRNSTPRALVAVEALILFTTLALAAVGVVVLARARDWLALAATLTFAAYDIVLSAGAEGDARLRMPAAPFLAVLAGVAVSSLAGRSAGRPASPSR
jgi:hypothetical protein